MMTSTGRPPTYRKPRSVTLFLPEDLLEKCAAADIPGANSRNAKLVDLLTWAIEHRPEIEPESQKNKPA